MRLTDLVGKPPEQLLGRRMKQVGVAAMTMLILSLLLYFEQTVDRSFIYVGF